jgi:serine/threonine-protein kinase RsbW
MASIGYHSHMHTVENRFLNESWPAVADSAPQVRSAVTAFAESVGIDDEQLDDVRLAVSEAMNNVIRHAYGEDEGSVCVTAVAAQQELVIIVEDDGQGIRPAHAKSEARGFGLTLMVGFSDGLSLANRPTGGLETRLKFNLAPG